MFQILLFLPHVNSTLTNLPLYGQLWHKFLLFFYSTFSLISPVVSPSNPNPLLSNPTLSLCLPLPVSLSAVALLGLGVSMLTKTLTFAAAFSAFGDPIPWLIALAFFFARGFIKTGLGNRIAYQLVIGANLTFNMIKQTIGWTDWAKAAIVPGLASLIVGVICNGVRWYGCGVLICVSGFWVVVV
uniref:Uncharacterized protein n=1 Tax=Quercus lobata TaxID=97700 RepID=A0A7N2M2Q0_QUELO